MSKQYKHYDWKEPHPSDVLTFEERLKNCANFINENLKIMSVRIPQDLGHHANMLQLLSEAAERTNSEVTPDGKVTFGVRLSPEFEDLSLIHSLSEKFKNNDDVKLVSYIRDTKYKDSQAEPLVDAIENFCVALRRQLRITHGQSRDKGWER